MIITKKLSETMPLDTPNKVDARNLYNTENAMINVVTLKPGESLRKHITPVDVAFYALKGQGVVLIGEEIETIKENTLVESPKNIVHCWYNESDSDFVFMVIKVPRPEKKSTFIG